MTLKFKSIFRTIETILGRIVLVSTILHLIYKMRSFEKLQVFLTDTFAILVYFFEKLKTLADIYVSIINTIFYPLLKLFELFGIQISQSVINGLLGSFAQIVVLIGYLKSKNLIMKEKQYYLRFGGEVKYFIVGFFEKFSEAITKKSNKLLMLTSILYFIYIVDVAIFVSIKSALITLTSTTGIVLLVVFAVIIFDFFVLILQIFYCSWLCDGTGMQLYIKNGEEVNYWVLPSIKPITFLKSLLEKVRLF